MVSFANLYPGYGMRRMIFLIGMSLMMFSSVLSVFTVSQGSVATSVISTVCTLYATIHAVIFVLGLILIIIGAALYAGSHVLPGNLKSNAQGYGMGMIVGGVVGVILALSAPFILQVITGNSTEAASCSGYTSF